MANIDLEKYIKDLSPELQEKAKACNNTEELLNLAEENDIELPVDALEAVAGGCSCEHSNTTIESLDVYAEYKGATIWKISKSKCSKCGENYRFVAYLMPDLNSMSGRMETMDLTEAEYNELRGRA